MARILIIDDDSASIDRLSRDLQSYGHDVSVARDGAIGLAAALKGTCDATIIDVAMPGLGGFPFLAQLRQQAVTRLLPIIVLTAWDSLDDKVRGFDAGADDYVVKPAEPRELLVRLRAVLRRHRPLPQPISGEILSAGDFTLFPEALQVHVKSKAVTLTPTECELVHCLLQHADQPVALATILQEVWGYDPDEDVVMLRVHIRRLRVKFEANPKSPRYLVTVPNIGYRLAVSP